MAEAGAMTVPGTDRSAMSSGERWVVVGGLGLAVASLVPWYAPEELTFAFEGPTRTNGWQEPDATLSVLATVVGVALAIAVLVGSRQSDRPRVGTVSWGTLLTAASAGVLGLVALKYSLNMEGTTVGVYLALTAAVTQLYGAYVTRTEEATSWTPVATPTTSSARVGMPTMWRTLGVTPTTSPRLRPDRARPTRRARRTPRTAPEGAATRHHHARGRVAQGPTTPSSARGRAGSPPPGCNARRTRPSRMASGTGSRSRRPSRTPGSHGIRPTHRWRPGGSSRRAASRCTARRRPEIPTITQWNCPIP
jgi:hypothetical protein